MATKIRAGTSGYSYKGWRGAFYPEDLPEAEWLSFYASQLPTVEINNTFYRMPKGHVVEKWRDSVGDEFRFVIKASRRISHQHRLKDADEATGWLVKRAETFGSKLGAVLVQLPPNMKANIERLQVFQDLIPPELPLAFEFRHESWLEEGVVDVLAARGHGLVTSDDDGKQVPELPAGALLYLRLRAEKYTPAVLQRWHGAIQATKAKDALVFFKHEDAGAGPALARKFLDLAGTKPAKPPARAARRKKAAASRTKRS